MAASRLLPRFRQSLSRVNIRGYTTAAVAGKDGPFDIFAACCLQRFPVIQPELSELEVKAKEMFRQMEIKNSLMSEHEIRHRNDQAVLKKKAKAAAAAESGIATAVVESGPFVTALEAEDMWEAEKNRFKLGSRVTEADEKNDTTSAKRALDKKLVLVLEQKVGSQFHLVLPQIKWQDGESLRQTAERALTTALPGAAPSPQNVQSPFPPLVQFIGNAPVGVYSYRYPKAIREKLKSIGAKVFFFKAHLLDWQVNLKISPDGEQYRQVKWLTKEELIKTLEKDYAQAVAPFLLDF